MITKRVDTEGNKVNMKLKLTRLKLCSHFSEGVVGAQGEPSKLRAGCSADRRQAHSWRWTWQGEFFYLLASSVENRFFKLLIQDFLRVVVEICRQHFGRLMWRRGRRFGRRS